MKQLDINNLIVDEARSWLGTPWKQNHQVKLYGVDCLQLVKACIRRVEEDMNLSLPFNLPRGYNCSPKDAFLLSEVNRQKSVHLVSKIEPGNIGIVALQQHPNHIFIFTSENTVIHTSLRYGVVESTFGNWLSKLVAVYEVKE